jgi:hypothetical protein
MIVPFPTPDGPHTISGSSLGVEGSTDASVSLVPFLFRLDEEYS